jgi:integrase
MKPKRITDLTIKAATERMTIGDGLYMLVSDTGKKLWRYNYRIHGKPKTIAYGVYPDVSLALAKERHAEARRLLALDPPVDPMADKKEKKHAAKREHDNSFKSVAEAYLKWWSPGKHEDYVERVTIGLERDVYPAIGHMPIAQIEAPHIIAIGKAVEARGAEETARRLLGKIGEIFSYAVGNGIIRRNPANDFQRNMVLQPTEVVNHPFVPIEEVGALLRKIDLYYGTPVVRLALKILPLIFVRPGKEFLGWRWDEIDWADKTWTIPKGRMKKRREHMVPLATQTIALLKQLHTLTGDGPLLFPAQKLGSKNGQMADTTLGYALEGLDYKGKQSPHGFRGLASTILYDKWKTTDPLKGDIIELQLAHVVGGVKGVYNKAEHIEVRKVMMQWYANYLEAAQRDDVDATNVVPFPVARAS